MDRRGHEITARAFTLIEVLAVMAILTILIAILLPAINGGRSTAKMLQCSSNMRTVAVEFGLFASGNSENGRGDSESLSGSRFWIGDFQDSCYKLDEFWDLKEAKTGILSLDEEPALCPAGARQLMKRKGSPCSREAIAPIEDVSIAVNMRLYRAVVDFRGKQILAPAAATHVSARILNHPYVPLVMDVDGREAVREGNDPFYIAPPLPETDDPYARGRYWLPSKRHRGKTIVAFVGGHVLSSTQPQEERWDWAYQAEVGR